MFSQAVASLPPFHRSGVMLTTVACKILQGSQLKCDISIGSAVRAKIGPGQFIIFFSRKPTMAKSVDKVDLEPRYWDNGQVKATSNRRQPSSSKIRDRNSAGSRFVQFTPDSKQSMMAEFSRILIIFLQFTSFTKIRVCHSSDELLTFSPPSQLSLINQPSSGLVTSPETPAFKAWSNMSSSPLQARALGSMYKYDQVNVVPLGPSKDNPSIGGFVKQKCYKCPWNTRSEHYCIYANPEFADKRGMILFIRPSFLKIKIKQFDLSESDAHANNTSGRSSSPYQVRLMPEKGGVGAIATKKLQLGDLVLADYALVTVFANYLLWAPHGWSHILKDMVDLLPIKGRELFARQHGVGNTEVEWIASTFDRNSFTALKDDEDFGGFTLAPEAAVSDFVGFTSFW